MLHTDKIKFEPKQDFVQNKGKRKNPDNLQQTTSKKKQKIASDQGLFTNELAKYLEEQTDLESVQIPWKHRRSQSTKNWWEN